MGMTKTKEERDFLPINIAVLTVSDTRGIEDDKSGDTLVDRINGEVNNRTTITKNEAGTNEDLTVSAGSQDVIVNIIEDTLARGYEVKKQEIFLTKHKSYRAYVMVELSKKEVEAIIETVSKKNVASIDVDAINKQADKVLN